MKKKAKKQEAADELRSEYDFSTLKNGVRGKYAVRFSAGTNLVLLSPDVAKYSLTNSPSMPHCEP
jgi:hypothetical protein